MGGGGGWASALSGIRVLMFQGLMVQGYARLSETLP